MMSHTSRFLPLVFGLLFLSLSGVVQASDGKDKLNSGTLSGLSFRSIGPALMSGRISDIAIDPVKPNTWYVAVGSGNLWKTTNAGTTWNPIFDHYPSYSIGCVTLDPSDHNTVWVGTGEAVGGRHVGYGDGVYLSRDGGKSFVHRGLPESEHIAKIIVDPRNSNVIYVASQGPLWSKGGERGLYKSTDQGETWSLILSKGPFTGVTDIVLDPTDHKVLYAATHQRHRTVAALMNGGPESGIFKSIDGGATFQQLKKGLPSGDKGKIALGVSQQDSSVIYASIELPGKKGGFWRSTDGGNSWTKRSDYISGGTGPHYYQEMFVDPHRFDVIYQANVVLGRSEDGGSTWSSLRRRTKHVDNHAVAFHPNDPDFLLVGCDGGLYKSFDRGQTYDFTENLPLTQFYKVDVDYDWPVYHVVGGTQDNNTQYGPTRTLSRNGIRNSDWKITIGGDGHDCAIDPKDPDTIYCESQQGYIRRYDRKTGESVDIRPQPGAGEDYFRFNWDSPILISPHSHTRLYFGSKILHRSDDRGNSWTALSGDLSRGRDRLTLPIMDRIWSVDATWDVSAMSKHGNITSISESPLVEGLIYVGTDDGLIQVTEDGGKNWRRVEKIYGVPEFAFINDIKADLHEPETVYAALDNHKEGEYEPFLIKSTDRGKTWRSIVADLPSRLLVWRIIQDHVNQDLLFAGTETGVYCTLTGGKNWIKLAAGVPTIPFRDLAIQRRENDLVGATFGRGFYVLDDYSPLRHVSEEMLNDTDFAFFPIKKAQLYIPRDELGGLKGSQGDTFYAASNPPYGAIFTCYLRDPLKTLKKTRSEKEQKIKKSGGDNPYPGWEALKAEDLEDGPSVVLEIKDSKGKVVNRIAGPTSPGIHRLSWDLRYAPFTSGFGRGGLVTEGHYSVQAFKRVGDELTALGKPQGFDVEALFPVAAGATGREETLTFQMKLGEFQRSVSGARSVIDEALRQVSEIKTLIKNGRSVDLTILEEARSIELGLINARDAIDGDRTKARRGAVGAPSVSSRLRNALFGTMNHSSGPTQTQRDQASIAINEYKKAIGTIKKLVEVDLEELKGKLDKAGAPWTPGRKIPDFTY